MSEERSVSMDILPVGMAEQFTEFLEEVQNKMAELVTDSDQLARKLDNKDDNTENQDFARLFKTMAESANRIIGVVRDAAEIGIEKLEEKTGTWGVPIRTSVLQRLKTVRMHCPSRNMQIVS